MNIHAFSAEPPVDRNLAVVAAIMKHLYDADQPVEYTALYSQIVAGTGLSETKVCFVVNKAIFSLIAGGLLECSTRDKVRQRTTLGLGSMISLSENAHDVLSQEEGQPVDPNAPHYNSHETDALTERLGNLNFSILNYPFDGYCFLAFRIRPEDEITTDNILAAKELSRQFDQDMEVRESLIHSQLNEGGGFVCVSEVDLGFRSSPAPERL